MIDEENLEEMFEPFMEEDEKDYHKGPIMEDSFFEKAFEEEDDPEITDIDDDL